MKKTTLRDLAEHLNVSQNTVSIALRNRPGINENTRQKILEAAREMGYIQPGSKQEVRNICIVSSADNLSDTYFYIRIQYAIEAKARLYGYGTLLYNSLNVNQGELKVMLKKNHVKGIIILGDLDISVTRLIREYEIPVITSGFYYHDLYTDSVIEENISGMFKVIEYLTENNFHSIGFIGNPSNCMGFLERYMGYMGAMQQKHLKVESEWVVTDFTAENEFEPEYMEQKLKDIIKLPQVFVCANDRVSVVALKALYNLGIRVPRDISLVGFDNSEQAKMSIPTITTVDVNIDYQAEVLIKKLKDRIEGKESQAERIIIPVTLSPGESVGTVG